jgi:murein DD-endopeptidase MepM/ murein hydrolase activator NlpD
MKLKIITTTIITGLLIFFTACRSCSINDNSAQIEHHKVPLELPKNDVPLPSESFEFLLPKSELAKQTPPRKYVNFDFTARELSEVAAADKHPMKKGKSLIVDLGSISEEEFSFPLPNAKVISPYAGNRKHHSGVDLKTFARDTIVAAFDGVVRIAKPYYAYGNIVVIRHHNGLETLYSHNHANLVKPGDVVKAGQPIGIVGRTGRATTDHLHFEVRVNGQHINPAHVFDLENHTIKKACLMFTQKPNRIEISEIKIPTLHLVNSVSYSAPDKKEDEGKGNNGES